ncbi:metalloendoproteinase 1 [Ziziphus jujuba]|uniref:Metalloendoproteinase 1 n=1 Tax=Ziziphus jujuba TaxID=326968 RepID=A0A6P4AWA4_ZIZJJ|nr:metalloendoproteinase 1 [Ziziphus jujuba]
MASIITHSMRAFLVILITHLPVLVLSRTLEHTHTHTNIHPHSNPPLSFKSLRSLEGLRKGQTAKGLSNLKRYLNRFGYLNSDDGSDYFDEVLESAVKHYQQNYNLNATGKLDYGTMKNMVVPRCGVRDSGLHGHESINGSLYSFFDGNPKWPSEQTHLTYKFSSAVQPVSLDVFRSVAAQAFAEWQRHSQFTFEEVQPLSRSDLTLGFFVGDHGDGFPFDGSYNILGHAFSPTNGRLHLDGDETWTVGVPSDVDLFSVVLHEIGHLLGLAHSLDQNAVMYAQYTPAAIKRTLIQDDIDGIRALYSTP